MYEWIHKKLKLSHHRHSGHLLPHHHTSHGALFVVILATGLMLGVATRGLIVSAQTVTESGSLDVFGTVPGPPPSEPAVIIQPKDGDVFTSPTIEVSGTCPDGTIVEIYKNDILAGSTPCSSGQFKVEIDLIIGKNKLQAKVVDNLAQYGPDSNIVNVTYRPSSPPKGPSGTADPGTPGPGIRQFIIVVESQYFGTLANSRYKLEITIGGGVAPYAIIVDWGDGQEDLISRNKHGKFSATHTYKSADMYYLIIKGSDAAGNKAQAKTAVLISGFAGPIQREEPPVSVGPTLAVIWPLYVSAALAVATFWLGEKYGKQEFKHLWKTRKT